MATLASPMPTTAYDQDLDTFINLDQLAYTSADVARPKVALASQPSVANTEFTSDRSASFASSDWLAAGALSMAYSQVTPMNFNGSQGYPMGGDMYAAQHIKRDETPFDFNTVPARNPSEMDVESDSMSSNPYFYSATAVKNQYIDPNALGGHELAQVGPSTQVGRMYPGMHQQQAAMAKAAQQQKQNEMIRHQMQQQQRRPGDVPAATPNRGTRNPDPVVEERISQLLQQMRQRAVAAGEASPDPSSDLPHLSKSKKDEAEMDEDERLLASEEGKKLSSKERRQLRNKVSARAFRSRRKEYIGQLESEVAARTNEAHDLRMENRSLYEENARLNDLARMLLGSPHFANFLNEMPDSIPAQVQAHQQPQQPQQPQQQPQQVNVPKQDAAPRGPEFQLQQTPQANMMMAPSQGMDASMINNSGWNSGIDMNFGNPSVFAVLDVPEGPALDVEALSGKSSSPIGAPEPAKDMAPVIGHLENEESTQKTDVGVLNPDVEIDESDPAFALFVDSPAPPTVAGAERAFDGVGSEKPDAHYELVVDTTNSQARLNMLCSSMEAAFERVSALTSHLQ
ncbi:hypothetical protein N7470_003778 [Penicillium chermesinum]|nr:hypothetical protein N7470_003778 [Penicillium chermesinum]